MNFFSIDYRLSPFSFSFPSQITRYLNEQQKKIAFVAIAIFAVITAMYLIYRFIQKSDKEEVVYLEKAEQAKYKEVANEILADPKQEKFTLKHSSPQKKLAAHANVINCFPNVYKGIEARNNKCNPLNENLNKEANLTHPRLCLTYIDHNEMHLEEETKIVSDNSIEEIEIIHILEESKPQPLSFELSMIEQDEIKDSDELEERQIDSFEVEAKQMLESIHSDNGELIDSDLDDWVILDSKEELEIKDSVANGEFAIKTQNFITDVPALVGLGMGLGVRALSNSSFALLPKGAYGIKQLGEKFLFIFPVLPLMVDLMKTISQDHTSDLLPTKLMRAIKKIDKADLLMTLLSSGIGIASAGVSSTLLHASIIAFEISSEAILEDLKTKEHQGLSEEGEFERSSIFLTILNTIESSLRIFSFYQLSCDNNRQTLSLGFLLTFINLKVVKMLSLFYGDNANPKMITYQ